MLVDRNIVDFDYINGVFDEIYNIFAISASEAFGRKVIGNKCISKITVNLHVRISGKSNKYLQSMKVKF